MILSPSGSPITSEQTQQLSVGDLVKQCQDAVSKMSATNDHRRLLMQCCVALADVSMQLAKLKAAQSPRVVV